MTFQSYIFQSTSTHQVQVGRLDSSTVEEETDTKTETEDSSQKATLEVETTPELTTQEPEKLNLTSPNQILDLYV